MSASPTCLWVALRLRSVESIADLSNLGRREAHIAQGHAKDLAAAYSQLNGCREALGNPPLLLVCDLARFKIHTTNCAGVGTMPSCAGPARSLSAD